MQLHFFSFKKLFLSFMTSNSLLQYSRSSKLRKHIPDWIAVLVLVVYFFFVAEHAKPFSREFSLSDLTISHPFATKQKVSGPQCFILASALPALVITIITFLKWSRSGKSRQEEQRFFHVLQVALLGLAVSISLTAIVTDILKNWIARPRPDFLARCGAPRDKFSSQFVNLGVCTAPYGMGELLDGLRSTPSGHSSISFASFLYLTLWLLAQFELTKSPPQHMYKHILVWLPLLFASYVSLSRVQDYRHHFTDVIFGTLIGCLFAWIVFHHYWEGLRSIDCSLPKTWNEPKENATILPI